VSATETARSKFFIFLPCSLAGIVDCIKEGCKERVTWHALLKTSTGAKVPPSPLYWCHTHYLEIISADNAGLVQILQ
jgi:hypothetical protein